MAQDKNGALITQGDTVSVTGTITSVDSSPGQDPAQAELTVLVTPTVISDPPSSFTVKAGDSTKQ